VWFEYALALNVTGENTDLFNYQKGTFKFTKLKKVVRHTA